MDAGHARVRAGRPARHPDDDPAAAGVHRQAARRAPLPRGDRLRQGADRRRAGRLERPDGVPRLRHRVRLPDPDAGARSSGPGEWQKAITGITGYNKAVVSLEPSPMLLGVGYIIGPRIASVMVGGGILTALLLVPMIAFFGDGRAGRLAAGPAADRRDERRGDLGPVRPLHRRRRGGRRRHHQHAQRAAADRRPR